MPLNKKGHKIMAAMKEQYGEEEGERVFYASKNAGKISGVDHPRKKRPMADADPDGHVWTRGCTLADTDTLLDGVCRHRDGYLTCEARVARTGLQRYRGYELGLPQQEQVILYRPAEEVFARDAMRSLANKPITLTHPREMVDARSWSKVAKGFSGSEVMRDGEYVRIPLMLTDAAAIEAFESGKARELSVGYTTDIDWTPGITDDGDSYHGVQRLIRGNHHALVPVARGGESLRFGDDGEALADYSDDQERDSKGRWTSGAGPAGATGTKVDPSGGSAIGQKWSPEEEAHFQDLLKQIGAAQAKRKLTAAPSHMLNPELDWEDNELNDPTTRALMNMPELGEPKHLKIPKGSPFARDGIVEPYWLADREFTAESRKKGAEEGWAKPDGSYPIRNKGDLGNAIRAWGRGGATASDKAWIKKRAKALGATSMLPENWQTDADPSGGADLQELNPMPIIRTFDGIPISFGDEVSAAAMDREMRKLRDQIENFKGKRAKPFGKGGNGDNANNNDDNDDNRTSHGEDDGKDAGQDEADRIEAKRRKVTAEDALKVKDGEIAVLKKQLADAQTTDAKVEALAAERITLIDAAAPLLPKDFNPAGKSLADIRRAAVATSLGDAEIKDWDDAQVTGAFRALSKTGAASGGARKLADGLTRAMSGSGDYRGSASALNDAEKEADKAYGEYVKRLQDGYRQPLTVVRN